MITLMGVAESLKLKNEKTGKETFAPVYHIELYIPDVGIGDVLKFNKIIGRPVVAKMEDVFATGTMISEYRFKTDKEGEHFYKIDLVVPEDSVESVVLLNKLCCQCEVEITLEPTQRDLFGDN